VYVCGDWNIIKKVVLLLKGNFALFVFICDTLFALLPSPGTQVDNKKNVTYNHLLVSALRSFPSLFSFPFPLFVHL